MGRVRTKTVKKAARAIVEKFYARMTADFHINKRICDEFAVIQTKGLRNKIAGYATHLMKRIQKGPVRGISLKIQEEEREKKLDYIPERSIVSTKEIRVDAATLELLKALDLAELPNIKVEEPKQ
ncbi:unnamed protein product [Blepharisma stoltei]|uniref:40S ribosomal protein S17 n=1 Tax=Blepharisma stoltei TaxID=1481888 RepID=A0AAU9JWU7_9CILI|nr:unnamed protein product [Blepharisma stoltei]